MTYPSCPDCETGDNVTPIDYVETVTMKGTEITFPANSFICTGCWGEFDTAETLDKNLASARQVFVNA